MRFSLCRTIHNAITTAMLWERRYAKGGPRLARSAETVAAFFEYVRCARGRPAALRAGELSAHPVPPVPTVVLEVSDALRRQGRFGHGLELRYRQGPCHPPRPGRLRRLRRLLPRRAGRGGYPAPDRSDGPPCDRGQGERLT